MSESISTTPDPSLKIELREISTIRPYDKNPRLNDKAVDPVAVSLKEFGFRQPIVIDGDNVIVVGHTRYRAALKLGLTKVPVHLERCFVNDGTCGQLPPGWKRKSILAQ